MSTARFNTLTDASGGNSMPVADINQGRAKVWAWLNGTGVIATLDSFGVSSFTDNGAGDYTCNFTTPFANAVYPGFVTGDTQASGFLGATGDQAALRTTAGCRTAVYNSALTAADGYLQAMFLGDR